MGWEDRCLLDVHVAGPGGPWCPPDRFLACFADSPLPVPSFLVRMLLGRVPGGGAEMGWRVPPIPWQWSVLPTGMLVWVLGATRGPKEGDELEELVLEGVQ